MRIAFDVRHASPVAMAYVASALRAVQNLRSRSWQFRCLGPVPTSWRELVEDTPAEASGYCDTDLFVQLAPWHATPSILTRGTTEAIIADLDGIAVPPDRRSLACLLQLRQHHAIHVLRDADARTLRNLVGPAYPFRTGTPEMLAAHWARMCIPPRRVPNRIRLVAAMATGDPVADHSRRVRDALATHGAVECIATPADAIRLVRAADTIPTLFIVGDHAAHAWVAEWQRRAGGVLLLHGEYLAHQVYGRYGIAGLAHEASGELSRPVTTTEAAAWLMEPHTSPVRCLPRTSPILVHSNVIRETLANRGINAHVVPYVLPMGLPSSWAPSATLRVLVHAEAASEVAQALDLLNRWGIPNEVTWLGTVPTRLLRAYGIRAKVVYTTKSEQIATLLDDIDVVLLHRQHASGGVHPTLIATLSAGVPSVCVEAEARLLDIPSYIVTVPDRLSPLLLAEAIRRAGTLPRQAVAEERTSYIAKHSTTAFMNAWRCWMGW